MNKHPLGIKPEYIWKEERFFALTETMKRYLEFNLPIRPEWVKEYNNLYKELTD